MADILNQSHMECMRGKCHGNPCNQFICLFNQVSGDDLDRGTLDPSNSSIRALASRVNISFDDLVRGPQSLGALLVKRGYRAVPSPDEPGPDGNPYFDGEYDIFVHGSSGRGYVDGIMAESAQAYRKPDTLRTYAKDFAGTIVEFMQLYYNLQVPRYSPIINAPTLNADDSAKTKPESNNDDSKSSKLKRARQFAEDYQNRKLLKCVFERILTSRTNLKKTRTDELRTAISKKSKVNENEIFVDSSVTPSIPLAPSKNESKSIILISNDNGKSFAKEMPISEIPVVSAISGFMNILRIYTHQKNRKKVEIAAKSILGGLK